MSLAYADTSAIVRAYFPDEDGHAELRAILLEGDDAVVTSELAQVEMASAVRSAQRAGRLADATPTLSLFTAHCARGGPLTLLRLRAQPVLATARDLIGRYPLRTLDALHLAVAHEDAMPLAGADPLVFVTRDDRQAAAAQAIGFTLG